MIFGKDTHLKVGKLIREYGFKKVLIHFGGGSVKRTGLLDTVCRSLEEEGIGYVLLGAFRPIRFFPWQERVLSCAGGNR